MKYKKIFWLIIGFGSIIILAYFLFLSQINNDNSKNHQITYNEFKSIIANLLPDENLSAENIRAIFNDPSANILSPSGEKQFVLIDLESASGTGGIGGAIIAIDLKTRLGINIGGYLGSNHDLVFAPSELYFTMSETSKNGLNCFNSYNVVFSTISGSFAS